jgi:hypothetical protein
MLLMYNRTYAAEIGAFSKIETFLANISICRRCKETFGDCGEGEETGCYGYEWQCTVGEGRVEYNVPENKTGYVGCGILFRHEPSGSFNSVR